MYLSNALQGEIISQGVFFYSHIYLQNYGVDFLYAETDIHRQSAPRRRSAEGRELPGHADVSAAVNVCAHSRRKTKRASARLLDKVRG